MPDLEMTVATEPEALSTLTATSTYPDPSPRGREQRSAFRARLEAADHAWSLEQAIRAVCSEFTEWVPLLPIRNHDLEQVATVEMNDAIVGLVVAREVTAALLTGAAELRCPPMAPFDWLPVCGPSILAFWTRLLSQPISPILLRLLKRVTRAPEFALLPRRLLLASAATSMGAGSAPHRRDGYGRSGTAGGHA